MQRVLAQWNALDRRSRRLALAGVLVFAFACAIGAALGRDTRVPLFATPLRSEQLAEVVERLAQWNVPFVAGADNVRVDAGRRNDLLLQLALAGLPHPHLDSSAEALAKAGPLTPQSVLDAQATQGLAGDLSAGLRKLAGVRDAQVIIAPGASDAFASDAAHGASASVRLALEPGASLSREALGGVRAFVASAVSGLDPKRVAILDDRGLALGGDAQPDGGEAASLQASLQSALDLALGAGATIVRVRVSYDPRVRDVHAVVRKPIGSRAIGTTTANERYQSTAKQYTKSNVSVDAGSVTEDDRIETPGGRLERISVAVAVDSLRHLDLEKIRSLSKATLGIVSSRGDQLSVEEVAFAHDVPVLGPSRFASALGFAAALAPTIVIALALVAIAWFGARPAARACEALTARAALQRAAVAVTPFVPSAVRGRLANEPPHTAAAIISALPAATASAVLELYPAAEREAIVRRMARGTAPVVPDYETIARRG